MVVAAVALAAVCVRLPFLGVGLVPDEGGYAYAASAWAEGARLYGDAWVDRPQGLVVAYRMLLSLHESPEAIRLGALAAGAAATMLALAVGWLAHSPAAGLWAAALYAVVGVAPRLEGYTLHGELAAAVPATAAIAVALSWRRRRRAWLLVLAGALAACGVLMKQSGFDGLVVALVIAVTGAPGLRRALARGALVMAGAAAPLGAAAVHGVAVGFEQYWHAVVGYRLAGAPSVEQRVEELTSSLDLAARDLLPLAVVAAVGAAGCLRDRDAGRLALVWFAAAFAGFHIGGAYWAHYYLQLIAPLSLLAGIALVRLSTPALRVVVAGVALAPVVVLLGQLALAGPEERARLIPSKPPADRDERVARYLRRQTAPDEHIYVLVSRANVYYLADRGSPTPYLWHPPLRIAAAMRHLRRALSGPCRPAFVVLYQRLADVDPSRRLERLLAAHYVTDDRAPPGLPPILVRRDRLDHAVESDDDAAAQAEAAAGVDVAVGVRAGAPRCVPAR